MVVETLPCIKGTPKYLDPNDDNLNGKSKQIFFSNLIGKLFEKVIVDFANPISCLEIKQNS